MVRSDALRSGSYEAVLVDLVSGPSMFRFYRTYSSRVGGDGLKLQGNGRIDAALDRVRFAASDGEYRSGVADFQREVLNDPPALFLAWGERARAVSRRFVVPEPEPGRDVLSTIREWRPADARVAGDRN